MVVYTFVSLSILAEPIVERRAPAQPSAMRSRDRAIPAGRGAARARQRAARCRRRRQDAPRQKLTYRVLGSAFHDGTRTNAADLLYAYMFAYRWGARAGDAERSLRSVHRCRDGGHARSSFWECASSAPTRTPNRSASATSSSCANCFMVEVYTRIAAVAIRSRMPSLLRPGARALASCWC